VEIQRLQIDAFRNLDSARLEPVPGLNRLIGPNGSGKTSLLEAICYLGTGRSFRRTGTRGLRQEGREEALVFGEVRGPSPHRLGVRLAPGQRELRLDGRGASGFGDLAAVLKIVHYTPEEHRLADGGPRERRRFLDWGLFHVEPPFLELARRYNRALQQRNRWLKGLGHGSDPWLEELARTGEEIVRKRQRFVARLAEHAERMFADLRGLGQLGVRLQWGWNTERTLQEALERDRETDAEATRVGPHRGDLKLTLEGAPVRERASRGQQKLVVLALRLAQLAVISEESGEPPVFLFDDVGSELDSERRGAALEILSQFGPQAFLTGTEEALCPMPEGEGFYATFRVHDGAIERSD